MKSMTKKETDVRRVAVIGAGAAGMMAAITAAEAGANVTLFERNDRVGKKLRITGKGRCNVTNNCDNNEFLTNVPTNPRFLYASLSRFSTADTMAFFEEAGVPLKTERGKRVFPVSDRAADIVSAMEKKCRASASLFAPQKFDFAQDDRLIYYFAVVQVKSILYSFLFYHKSPSFSTPFINFLAMCIHYKEQTKGRKLWQSRYTSTKGTIPKTRMQGQ